MFVEKMSKREGRDKIFLIEVKNRRQNERI